MKIYIKSKIIYRLTFLFLAILFMNYSCGENKVNIKTPELIEIWKIEPGKISSLDMEKIFFSKSYDLEFNKNSNFDIQYISAENILKITPLQDFFGLDFIEFTNSDQKFILPVLVEKKIPVTFEYTPEQSV